MKVYISGSKHVNALDDKAKEIIKGYINNGDELLVGDDDSGIDTLIQSCIKTYKNVTVYSPSDNARRNIGNWSVQRNEKGRPGASTKWFYHESAMAVEADCGFMIWNGRSIDAFINIINLTSIKKPVLVYNIETKKLTDIKSYEQLKSLLPDNPDYIPGCDSLQKDLNEYVIKNCGMSKEMTELFLNKPASKNMVVDLVMNAYIPLETKKGLLKRILPTDDFLHELYRLWDHNDMSSAGMFDEDYILNSCVYWIFRHCAFICSASKCYWEICEALKEYGCRDGEVFTITDCWYDADIFENKKHLVAVSFSFEEAIEAIKDNIRFEMDEEFESFDKVPNNSWYEIDKWTPDEKGHLYISYTYYVERISVINFYRSAKHHKPWFDDNLFDITDDVFEGLKCHMYDDNICPFNHGDIVTIDASPFADVFNMVVIRNKAEAVIRNRADEGICLFLFYDPKNNAYHIGPMGSAKLMYADNLKGSFVHKMSRHKGKLYGPETIFKKVSKWINGDKKKARLFYDKLYNKDCWDITAEEIEKFLNEYKAFH